MDDREKSDGLVVPVKLSNNAQGGAAEMVEGSGPAKGNTASETRPGLSAGQDALSDLSRVRRVAATDKEARFTALLHHVDENDGLHWPRRDGLKWPHRASGCCWC
jgi:RNA-directed DNA polymerase